MSGEKITVSTQVNAPLDRVWHAYTNPDDIVQWNAASDDWHTTEARVDLRPGGTFSSHMEAKDGSFGFDFAGTYTEIVPQGYLAYDFGDRKARVDFTDEGKAVRLTVIFEAETQNPIDMQRQGWQAILDSFKTYVEGQNPAA